MIYLIFQLGLSITTVLIMLLLAYLSINVKDLYIDLLLYQIYVYFYFEIYFCLLIVLLNANFVFVIFLFWVFLYFIRSSMPSAIALPSTNIFRDRYSNLLFILYFSFQLYISKNYFWVSYISFLIPWNFLKFHSCKFFFVTVMLLEIYVICYLFIYLFVSSDYHFSLVNTNCEIYFNFLVIVICIAFFFY